MNVTILLADAAQAVDGKLYILGGGWDTTGPGPITMAIALKIDVPWIETNARHQLRLALLDDDENMVHMPTPMGEQPFQINVPFEVGRPAGVRPGVTLPFPLAINLGTFTLPANAHYRWRCFIDNRTEDHWQAAFSTREAVVTPSPSV